MASWYSALLWEPGREQGMRSANFVLAPGSEAKIAGFERQWYARFDSKTEASDAVERRGSTMAGLAEASRGGASRISSRFTYSEPDHEGHTVRP